VALRGATIKIAASIQDTRSWGLAAPWGVGDQGKSPFDCCLWVLRAGSVQSIQHLQKHWILERNRHFADLEIDLLASVVRSEGFPDDLGKGLKRRGAEDRIFQPTPGRHQRRCGARGGGWRIRSDSAGEVGNLLADGL
jgi:hypothetical protein